MIINESTNWWENHKDRSFKRGEYPCLNDFINLFTQDCIKKRKTIYYFTVAGFFKDVKNLNKIKKEISLDEYYKVIVGNDTIDDSNYSETFVSQNSLFQIYFNDNNTETSFYGCFSEKSKFDLFQKLTNELKFNKIKSEDIYVMIRSEMGMRLHSLGSAISEFKETNYQKEVVNKFKNAVKQLMNPEPSGRLVIMDGTPGVGKSYLVRAFLNEIPNGIWIFVPSEMISAISGPELIPVLLREKQKDKPIYLVIEDADECLSKRNTTNISAISTLLNISDGIVGQLIDIRVICTTNTPADDLDDAVLRDGRLLERIEVKKLNYNEALIAYKGIKNEDPSPDLFDKNETYKIASIYSLAKHGRATKEKAKKTGFI